MCGIAAIFAYSADASGVDRDELIAIRDQMITRGPDGAGEWFSPDGRVGLAHRRLSIIDLSDAGAQPMWNSERTLCVTFNGEIYNYQAIRSELVGKGHAFHSGTDTEVLLHLYAEYGADMVHKLRGMYAFAIWDARNHSLFCARDPFGIKPLYYADDGRTIRIASQVKALLQSKHIDTSPEPAGHVGFFLWGHVPDPFTLYHGIKALPAGHTLTICQSGKQKAESRNNEPVLFCSIPQMLREATTSQLSTFNSQLLRDSLRDTVRHHLIADVPVGVFQSAGLDSSTLTAFVSEVHQNVRTVTLGFEEYRGTENDEVPLAETVARACKTEHQTVWVSRKDFEGGTEALFDAMDQPSTDGVNTFFVSMAAKKAGLKVALSGLGGDEIFGGYPSFHDVPRLVSALRPFQRFSVSAFQRFGKGFRIVSSAFLKRFTSPKYAGLLEYGTSFGGAYLLRRGMFMPWELPDILDPDLVREGWQRLNTLSALNLTADLRPLTSDRLRVSALELSWYMRNQLLRDSDWAGMAHSLEIRVPLVDVALLRALSPLLHSSAPPTKLDMARAPSSPLPASVLARPKTGFTVPVREWMFGSKPKAESGRQELADRGLRGWTKEVYARFGGSNFTSPRSRRILAPISARQRFSVSASSPERILVYRIGQLGDTIVALPAMWSIRKEFPNAHMALLSDSHPKSGYVSATDLLDGAGIFDEYIGYPVKTGLRQTIEGWRLIRQLQKRRFDTLAYLAPSNRSPRQIARDRWFFKTAGIHNFLGMDEFPELPSKRPGVSLPNSDREVDLLLKRLSASKIGTTTESQSFKLNLGTREQNSVTEWLSRQTQTDDGRIWLAIGPGSKMPAKRWPLERFEAVVTELINEFDVWPVVFGGPEDFSTAEKLIKSWSRGYNAAGALGVRSAALALKRCVLYLGNDTGTMHMAAAVGVPCVAIFSARERPGMWYPHGNNNRVFRSRIDCEGCGLSVCVERKNECLRMIGAANVVQSCREVLGAAASGGKTAVADRNMVFVNPQPQPRLSNGL